MTYPKYLVGESGDNVWIIRTRNPFLMANVSNGINSKGEISMDVWPASVCRAIPKTKFDKILDMMLAVYLKEVAPDYSGKEEAIIIHPFSSEQNPPTTLPVYSKKSRWGGTLHITQNVKLTSLGGEEEVLN